MRSILMPIEKLLSALNNVRSRGHNKWIASCPTREDKHPSMAITLCDNGIILIKDFGGESILEILKAIGMNFSDLYPDKIGEYFKPIRRPFNPADILACLANEIIVVLAVATDLIAGKVQSVIDYKRLALAVSRISSALEVSRGR